MSSQIKMSMRLSIATLGLVVLLTLCQPSHSSAASNTNPDPHVKFLPTNRPRRDYFYSESEEEEQQQKQQQQQSKTPAAASGQHTQSSSPNRVIAHPPQGHHVNQSPPPYQSRPGKPPGVPHYQNERDYYAAGGGGKQHRPMNPHGPESNELALDDDEDEPQEPDRLQVLLSHSKFECGGKNNGYYADDTVNCQVFHYCLDNGKHSWVCPEGQQFHQIHMICMEVSGGDNDANSFCRKSNKFHFVNDYLYRPVNEKEAAATNTSLRYAERYYPEGYYGVTPDEMLPPPSQSGRRDSYPDYATMQDDHSASSASYEERRPGGPGGPGGPVRPPPSYPSHHSMGMGMGHSHSHHGGSASASHHHGHGGHHSHGHGHGPTHRPSPSHHASANTHHSHSSHAPPYQPQQQSQYPHLPASMPWGKLNNFAVPPPPTKKPIPSSSYPGFQPSPSPLRYKPEHSAPRHPEEQRMKNPFFMDDPTDYYGGLAPPSPVNKPPTPASRRHSSSTSNSYPQDKLAPFTTLGTRKPENQLGMSMSSSRPLQSSQISSRPSQAGVPMSIPPNAHKVNPVVPSDLLLKASNLAIMQNPARVFQTPTGATHYSKLPASAMTPPQPRIQGTRVPHGPTQHSHNGKLDLQKSTPGNNYFTSPESINIPWSARRPVLRPKSLEREVFPPDSRTLQAPNHHQNHNHNAKVPVLKPKPMVTKDKNIFDNFNDDDYEEY